MSQAPPRILYVGDVAVEPTTGGDALLHRLFREIPPGSLRVVEGNLSSRTTRPEHRLPGTEYSTLRMGFRRLLRTRFAKPYAGHVARRASNAAPRLDPVIRDYRPDCIVTVPHDIGWIAAAAAAERHHLPLHLIVHDDWLITRPMPPEMATWANDTLGKVYRQAKTRWCVSPSMAKAYEKRYGVPGDVLYPSRAPDARIYDASPAHLSDPSRPVVLGYAGSIHIRGYATAIAAAAKALEPFGGRAVVYSALSPEAIRDLGLDAPNISVRPFLPSNELIRALHDEASLLIVPAAFDPDMRNFMELSFPSKLTDYTAAALPVLIIGPDYASQVVWGRENPDATLVADSLDPSVLDPLLRRFATDPAHRAALAQGSIRAGKHYFSHATATAAFRRALGITSDPGPAA